MEHGIFIFSGNSSFYYDFFTQAGFWLVFALLVGMGLYRRYPMVEWLGVILAGRIGFLIGSRLGGYSATQWEQLIFQGELSVESSQSIWGGILLGLVGILFAKRCLSFTFPVFKLYVIAVPFGLALQRVGCLIAGCCFGHPTDLFFGLKYGIYADAFAHHAATDQLAHLADHSLVVHPVPVYFMLSLLLSALLILKLEKRIRSERKIVFLGLGLLATGRLIVEFFRDPASNPGLQGETWFGLKYLQWFCLGIGLICALIFWLDKASQPNDTFGESLPDPHFGRWTLLLSVLAGSVALFYLQFSTADLFLIGSLFGVTLTAQMIRWYRSTPPHLLKWLPVLLIPFSVGLMAQTMDNPEEEPEKEPRHWNTLRLGGGFGGYEVTNRDCDGNPTSIENFRYRSLGFGYSHYIQFNPKSRMELGVNLGLGRNLLSYETVGGGGGTDSTTLYRLNGVGVYFKHDFRWFGVGIGGYRGNMMFVAQPIEWDVQTYIRVGPIDKFFVELGTRNTFHNFLNTPNIQFGIGSGFGNLDGTVIRAGLSISNTAGFYLGGRFNLGDDFVVSPYAFLGKNYGGGFSLEYVFGRR